MNINADNYLQGNRALAWVLLLYYHLVREGGFTHDQTVYIDPEEFNGFEYVAVEVTNDQRLDIDQGLLRRGAVIYLLCELNDMITDYEADYLSQPFTQKVLNALGTEAIAAIPEVSEIVKVVTASESALDYGAFQNMLSGVFTDYVAQELKAPAARTLA